MAIPLYGQYNAEVRDVFGSVIPGATVIVLSGTLDTVSVTPQPGTPLATIYSDPYGTNLINQVTNPILTDGYGQFLFCGDRKSVV